MKGGSILFFLSARFSCNNRKKEALVFWLMFFSSYLKNQMQLVWVFKSKVLALQRLTQSEVFSFKSFSYKMA